MPRLYVVATPIGNLEDISRRALRVLKEVGLIAAEDTRRTRHLLSAYGIKNSVTSYHEHNKKVKLPYILANLQKKEVALVSDAGMPGISDPGHDLIVAAIERGIPVVPVPGPSVLLTALVVSGLPSQQFLFLGFPPRRKGERRRLLESVASEWRTIIAFESPHRLLNTLKDLEEILGNRRIALCRELTKIHEEVFRGTIGTAIEYFPEPRGEFTLVIEGKGKVERDHLTEEMDEHLLRLKKSGMSAKEAVAQVAKASGISKREVYRAWLRLI